MIAVVRDQAKDDEVESLFECIKREQNGKLDICVNNNAYAGASAIINGELCFFSDCAQRTCRLAGALRGRSQ